MKLKNLSAFLVVVPFLLPACSNSGGTDAAKRVTTGAAAPADAIAALEEQPASSSSLSGAQVLGVLSDANSGEMEMATLAQSQSKNEQVLTYSLHMMDEHSAANEQATALAGRLGLESQESDLSKMLKDQMSQVKSSLQNLSGEEFDKAYLDSEVMLHQTLLNTIDNNLLPAAQNDELKALLTEKRAAVEQHLNEAKQLQASLSGGTVGTGAAAGTDTGAAAGTNTGAAAGTDTGAAAGTNTGTAAGTDTGAAAGTNTGTAAGTDTGAATGTDTGTGMDTGAASAGKGEKPKTQQSQQSQTMPSKKEEVSSVKETPMLQGM